MLKNKLFSKANILKNTGQYSEAIAIYDKVLAKDPNHKYSWLNKGDALSQIGETRTAIICFDKAIAIDPRFARAWMMKGDCLLELNEHKEALNCYSIVLEQDKDNEDAIKKKMQLEREMMGSSGDISRIDRLRKVISRSTSLTLEQLSKILVIEEDELLLWLIDLPEEFGFTIEQNVVNFAESALANSIDELLMEFERFEREKIGKIEQ